MQTLLDKLTSAPGPKVLETIRFDLDGHACCLRHISIHPDPATPLPELQSLVDAGYILGDWWCGYCQVVDAKVNEDDIDVHGGVTYCETEGVYTVYGFDCHHYGDEHRPELQNTDWLKAEVGRMLRQIVELQA